MNNNRGFTLLEILASVVILGIILTVFFQVFIVSQKATTSNEDKLAAINMAETVLERIKNGEYPEIQGAGKYTLDHECSKDNETEKCKRYYKSINGEDYEIVIELTNDTNSGNPNLFQANVRIFYEGSETEISHLRGLVEI